MSGTGNAFRGSMVPLWVVGHRGSPTEEVQNTISSFERAVARDGANALEMDICVTRDGELIVWHDFDPATLIARLRQWSLEPYMRHRPRSFSRPVSELTLAEARAQLGYVRVDARVPTFADVLAWSRAHPRLGLVFLDLKLPEHRADLVPVFLSRLDTLLAAAPPRFGLVIESAHEEILEALERAGSKHARALDVAETDGIDKVRRVAPAWACAMKPRLIHSLFPSRRQLELVDRLRATSVRHVGAFTVNQEDQMRALLRAGVNAIVTDRPALLRTVVEAHEALGARRRRNSSAPSAPMVAPITAPAATSPGK